MTKQPFRLGQKNSQRNLRGLGRGDDLSEGENLVDLLLGQQLTPVTPLVV